MTAAFCLVMVPSMTVLFQWQSCFSSVVVSSFIDNRLLWTALWDYMITALTVTLKLLPAPRRLCNRRCLFVCLDASNFAQKLPNICMKFSGNVGNGPMDKWSNFGGNPDHRLDCFLDSSPLGDTESGINRLCCATLQCTACTSRHCYSNYDVIMSLPDDRQLRQTNLGGGMHCPSGSSSYLILSTSLPDRY